MRHIWIVVLLVFLLPPVARASHWRRLTRHDGTEIYVDDASIAKRGELMQAWDRTDYPSPQTMTFAPFKQYRSMKALGNYNCSERTAALRELILYAGPGGSGEVVADLSVPKDHLDFKRMDPGSVGKVLVNYVCGRR